VTALLQRELRHQRGRLAAGHNATHKRCRRRRGAPVRQRDRGGMEWSATDTIGAEGWHSSYGRPWPRRSRRSSRLRTTCPKVGDRARPMKRRRRSVRKRNRQRMASHARPLRRQQSFGAGLRSRAHTADKGLEPAASTQWVFLLLLSGSGPAICWPSLSGSRGATDSVGRENRAAHRRSHRL
jgi:hypothetical protein